LDDLPTGILALAMFASILSVGFFSACETAMLALNRYRLRHLASQGNRRAKRALELLKRPDKFIIMVLIGNNLLGAIASALGALIGLRISGDSGVAFMTGLVAFLMMIFADNAPKSIAAYYPERIALPASRILVWLLIAQTPLVTLLSSINAKILRLFNIDVHTHSEEKLSSEELRTLVVDNAHRLPAQRQGMLLNILDLDNVSVESVMVPRNEISGIDLDDDDELILRKLRSYDLTRIPVYKGDINNVLGILHQRYVSHAIGYDGKLDRKSLLKEIDPPYFIPESTSLPVQLLNFRKRRQRMAMVVDEYGGVQGLLTLEDILEEIVGDFTSNDYDNEGIEDKGNGNYVIDGSTYIRDINKTLNWNLSTDGPNTLNGLLLEHLEAFPDGPVSLRIDDYYLEVISLQGNIVQKVNAREFMQALGN
jgi:Mg2+/Co2+ transporter CorB